MNITDEQLIELCKNTCTLHKTDDNGRFHVWFELDTLRTFVNQLNSQLKNETYRINTCMGEINSRSGSQLPFLSDVEFKEFNNIGYTGKDLKGNKTDRTSFLNSLNKGVFTIEQTAYDIGDFCESFIINRTYLKIN